MATASDAAPSERPLKRMRLVLDDGTVIQSGAEGGQEPALLRPAQAHEAGLLTEAHLLKAQVLLLEEHAKLPEEGPLRSVSGGSKRSSDTAFEAMNGATHSGLGGGAYDQPMSPEAPAAPIWPQHPPNKGHPQAPAAAAPPAYAAAAALPPLLPPVVPNWQQHALRIIDVICGVLGDQRFIFYDPVNAKVVKDYYRIIKNPICLAQIKQKISRRTYSGPQQFFEDMDLLIHNCFTYNKLGDPISRLGERVEACFLQQWAASPFAQLDVKRRPKLEQLPPAPLPSAGAYGAPQRAPPKRQAQRPAAPPRRQQPPQQQQQPREPRATSVNSYRNYQALAPEKQAQLAAALQDADVMNTKMEGVVGILQRNNELPTSPDGEVELDLSVISPATLWELFEFVFGRAAGPPGAPMAAGAPPPGAGAAGAPARSGFQLQEDSDYEPDEDDEEV